jgi:lysozyme
MARAGRRVAFSPDSAHPSAVLLRTRIFAASSLGLVTTLAAACGNSAREKTCADGAPLRVCAAGPVVHGIDVSSYQGAVDWVKVKHAGIDFAFARVSDGLNTPDAKFAANWDGMKKAGVVRGAYQFFRPSQDPVAQADLAIAALAANGPSVASDLPLVMDIEVTDQQTDATIRARMQAWLDRVAQVTGVTPILYTAAFMSSTVGSTFHAYALWVANYGATCPTMPASWTAWSFWQTSSSGGVDGIAGAVDLDDFNGMLADVMAFGKGAIVAASDGGAPDAMVDAPIADGAPTAPDASAAVGTPPVAPGDAGPFPGPLPAKTAESPCP